jgi:hypothetical protein
MPTVNSVPASATIADTRLELDSSRPRQTARPSRPFRELLAGGVDLLMAGAEVATSVVAGPVLAATVHDARAGAAGTLGRAVAGPAVTTPLAAELSGGRAGPTGDVTSLQAGLQDGQLSSAQLLVLQQQIQQENQQFSTLSNVMRAKHDTAKAAVSNIRA